MEEIWKIIVFTCNTDVILSLAPDCGVLSIPEEKAVGPACSQLKGDDLWKTSLLREQSVVQFHPWIPIEGCWVCDILHNCVEEIYR